MQLNFGFEAPEVNLDNPIFVYYVNVNGLSRQKADEMLGQLSSMFTYKNVTTWIVPRNEGETKIECVYDGRVKERSEELVVSMKKAYDNNEQKIPAMQDMLAECRHINEVVVILMFFDNYIEAQNNNPFNGILGAILADRRRK